MSDTILLLQLEHRHADRLLQLIEQQLELAPNCDLEVLGDIGAYFVDYPDLCHHPIEDKVFRRLAARNADAAAGLEPLLEQHEYLSEVAHSFAKLVGEARTNASGCDERLVEEARYFVEHYRQHMYAEEREFFPLAQRSLTKEDWAQIEFDMFDRTDPLYDSTAESRFRSLREKIEGEIGPSLERARALHRSRELHALEDITAFNSRMTESKRAFRLVLRGGGGYSLKHMDEALIDIPPCSEQRAAWCAWYFLQSAPH